MNTSGLCPWVVDSPMLFLLFFYLHVPSLVLLPNPANLIQQENVNEMIQYYSKKLGYDLGERNHIHLVYGTNTQSNLPIEPIDVIYSNATVHTFYAPDPILMDWRLKLKPTGKIFIRDSFREDHTEEEFCSDPKCAKPLYSTDEFLTMMTKNGYRLFKESPDMSGYPVFGFERID